MDRDLPVSVWPEWKIIEKIGEGSFGKVYKAQRMERDKAFYSAIKIITIPSNQGELKSIRSEMGGDQPTREYFQNLVEECIQEVSTMEYFRGNSHVVAVEDYKVVEYLDAIGWDIYIRMEYLTSFLEYCAGKQMGEDDVIQLGIDLCKALEYCQKLNIIHRDIKPENIFVSRFGEFKLGDFGIARELERTMSTLSKKGTYSYMAPEMYRGEKYDSRVDIYSLGIMLYKLRNKNRLPFLSLEKQLITYRDKENALTRRMSGEQLPFPAEAGEELASVILKACAYNRDERYEDAAEFRQALEDLKYNRRVTASGQAKIQKKEPGQQPETWRQPQLSERQSQYPERQSQQPERQSQLSERQPQYPERQSQLSERQSQYPERQPQQPERQSQQPRQQQTSRQAHSSRQQTPVQTPAKKTQSSAKQQAQKQSQSARQTRSVQSHQPKQISQTELQSSSSIEGRHPSVKRKKKKQSGTKPLVAAVIIMTIAVIVVTTIFFRLLLQDNNINTDSGDSPEKVQFVGEAGTDESEKEGLAEDLSEIRDHATTIVNEIDTYQWIGTESQGKISYLDTVGEVKKVLIFPKYSEDGLYEEYYYWNEKLFFAYIWADNSVDDDLGEGEIRADYYYYKDDKLIRWIDDANICHDYENDNEEYVALGEKYLKRSVEYTEEFVKINKEVEHGVSD